ncbi:MAG: hypothetical protein L0387_35350 [Acidobacteria bacterium]|nr:hypothetical protein [Acidobacteriota bacterium]
MTKLASTGFGRPTLILIGSLLLLGGNHLLGTFLNSRSDSESKTSKANSDPVYRQLRNIGLSGETMTVEQVELKRDVATITLKRGDLFFLAPVEGKVTGAVFLGEGDFQMTPIVPVEQKHLSLLTGASSISETFSQMVLRFTDSTYEELRKERKTSQGPPNSKALGFLAGVRKTLQKGRTFSSYTAAASFLEYNLDARLLVDLIRPLEHGLFHAYFDGRKHGELLFGIDPLGAPFVKPEEVVLVSLSDGSQGIWVAEHLQEHYRLEAVFDENHQFVDLEHHKIDARIQGKRLEARVETRFKAAVDGARVLSLDLFPTLRMRKVTDNQGRELNFVQEDKERDADFAVILAEPLRKGQTYSLIFEYGGDDAVMDSGGGNYTLIARSNWYPNASFDDRASYEMALETAKDLTMVGTGQPRGEISAGDRLTTLWKSDVPLAVAGFNFGRFKKSVVQDEKLQYAIETYANKELPDVFRGLLKEVEQFESQQGAKVEATLGSLNTVSLMEKARAEAQTAMQTYSTIFGPLPYGRIAMTQQPFVNFGQAWPMLVYMPMSAYFDSTHRHQLGMGEGRSVNFFKYVAAHEVAHQWWGHIIGWKSYRDQWMSEGFAEFSASLFAQQVYKTEKFVQLWKDLRHMILEKNRMGKRPSDVGGVYMGYRLDTAKTGSVTRAMIYPKGAFILHMLRMMMWEPKTGDARFTGMMKDFVKTYYNQNVSTTDFMRTVEKHMTKEMDLDGNGSMNWFLRQWIYGTTIPEYKLDYKVEPGDKGQFKVSGRITQSNVDDSFTMRVPFYVEFDGRIQRLGAATVAGNSATPEFSLVLPRQPKRVMLCAFEDVLCTIRER